MTTLMTHSLKESTPPTKSFERVVSPEGFDKTVVTPAAGRGNCLIFNFEDFATRSVPVPPKYTSITDVVNELESTEEGRVGMEDARRWVADTFHSEDAMTVRTLRLKMGWSQTHLAEKLGTSQSHIARIERGTENLYVQTCRRLCEAFHIDMNTLDQALQNQEQGCRTRMKR